MDLMPKKKKKGVLSFLSASNHPAYVTRGRNTPWVRTTKDASGMHQANRDSITVVLRTSELWWIQADRPSRIQLTSSI